MVKILLYAFYNRWGLCSRVVWELSDSVVNSHGHSLQLDKYYVNGLRGVGGLLKKIESENYDLVIGLGDYRKNAKAIRFETLFVNKYGKNKILEDGKELYNAEGDLVRTGLVPVQNRTTTRVVPTIQISDVPTNGPCNRSAYLVSELIERKELKTKLIFLHVPGKMELESVKGLILNLLDNFLLSFSEGRI